MSKEDLTVDIVDEAKLMLMFPHGTLLVNDQGNHYKYYNIYKQDNKAIAQWGRVGKKPQAVTYSVYEMKTKIREKVRKGYRIIREA